MNIDTPLTETGRLTDTQKTALKRLGLLTVRDLLYYFPVRYGDASALSYIADLKSGDTPYYLRRSQKYSSSQSVEKQNKHDRSNA